MKYVKTFENYSTHEAPFGEVEYNKEGDNSGNDQDINFLRRKFQSICRDRDIANSLSQVEEMVNNGEIHDYISFVDNSETKTFSGADMLYRMAIEDNREDIADLLYDNGIKIQNGEKIIEWCSHSRRCKVDTKYLVKSFSN